mmetsp:Transcript_33167/g.96738  ORF Transcript_33167/g.96738 Transcript_33167/m.96738 type:complete len:219 (-) Transcript_33167:292-948(-)
MCAVCMKKPSRKHFLMLAVSESSAFGAALDSPRFFTMPRNCRLMFSACLRLRSCRKLSLQNWALSSAWPNCEYTPRSDKWSPGPTAKALCALSAFFGPHLGRWKAGGTESIAAIARTSSTHPRWLAATIVLLRCGSTGKSAMCLPTSVRSHSSSTAPKKWSISSALIMDSGDGGSMKSKCTMSSTPSFFSCSTTELRLLRMISGYVLSGSSSSKVLSV